MSLADLTLLYGIAALAALLTAIAAVLVASRTGLGAVTCTIFGGGAASALFMIKARCGSGTGYNCGFIAFEGGFTWHFLPGAALYIAALLAAVFVARSLAPHTPAFPLVSYGLAPSAGLMVVLGWETLPRSIIHPPELCGTCPSLAIVCHDTPFLGRGGLLWWSLPFVTWIGIRLIRLSEVYHCT